MAQVINPWVQITGLSTSGQTDDSGTWNTSVSLASYGVPSTASAVLLNVVITASTAWHGFRDPAHPTALSRVMNDGNTGSVTPYIAPVHLGAIDLYVENTTSVEFWVAGYWEQGAVRWLSSGNEVTRELSGSGKFVWSFWDDDPKATGIVVNNAGYNGSATDTAAKWATSADAATYSLLIQDSTAPVYDTNHYIIPLNSEQRCYGDSAVATANTYDIVAFIRQPITFLYDDNGGPVESPTSVSWAAGGYTYPTEGIGCILQEFAFTGYVAAADTSAPVSLPTTLSTCQAFMHTVKADGTFNYFLETGTPSFDVFWFMGSYSGVPEESITPESILIHKPWTKKPPAGTKIDKSNPLARNMIAGWMFDTPGKLVDVYAGKHNSASTQGAPTLVPTPQGMATLFDGTADGYTVADHPELNFNNQSFTIMLGVTPQVADINAEIFEKQESAQELIQLTESNSDYRWMIKNGDPTNDILSDDNHGTEYDVLGLVWDFDTTETYWMYRNGVLQADGPSGTTGNDITPVGDLLFAQGSGGFSNVKIHFMYWYGRLLPEGEVRALTENPYQIFEPRTIVIAEKPDQKLVVF